MLASFGMNSVLSDASWSIIGMRFMVAAKFDFTPEYIPPPPQPVPPPEQPHGYAPAVSLPQAKPVTPAVPMIQPTLRIVCNIRCGTGGEEIPKPSLHVEEFVTTEFQPLLNDVFFDSASAAIPPRYVRLTKAQAMNFSDTSMLSAATFELYYNTLNFVGKRMQEYPDATLTITGCNSDDGGEEENLDLSHQRAEAVRNYLADVWSVAQGRMTLKAQNLPDAPSRFGVNYGDQENRRVEIISDDDRVISPLTLAGVQRQVSVPKVRFYMKSNAQSSISEWHLDAKRQGKVIASVKGEGTPPATYEMELAPLPIRLSREAVHSNSRSPSGYPR